MNSSMTVRGHGLTKLLTAHEHLLLEPTKYSESSRRTRSCTSVARTLESVNARRQGAVLLPSPYTAEERRSSRRRPARCWHPRDSPPRILSMTRERKQPSLTEAVTFEFFHATIIVTDRSTWHSPVAGCRHVVLSPFARGPWAQPRSSACFRLSFISLTSSWSLLATCRPNSGATRAPVLR